MLPNVTYELLKRGYSEGNIRKILAKTCACFLEAERFARSQSKTISGDGSLKRITR